MEGTVNNPILQRELAGMAIKLRDSCSTMRISSAASQNAREFLTISVDDGNRLLHRLCAVSLVSI
jgi:hypothetical protein